MFLTLEVISPRAAPLGSTRRKVFTPNGGRIGRAPENHMVLPGPGVHRHHATVRFIDGLFYIEGAGTNGIAVNDPVAVPSNGPYPLKSGDRLYIDEYELAVTAVSTVAADPARPRSLEFRTPPLRIPQPPGAAPEPGTVADASQGPFDIDSLLRAAGLDPAVLPADSAAVLGHIMRIVVQGLIEVLRARSEIKTELRMPVTHVKVSENNPLKFAADAQDAFAKLFGRHDPAYLGPQEAFEDAFDDLLCDQLAMLAGVRAGFDSLMSGFDPQQLEERFDQQGRLGLFSRRSARNWDLYTQQFRQMYADWGDTFQQLFGEEFARAYEEELAVLKPGSGGGQR